MFSFRALACHMRSGAFYSAPALMHGLPGIFGVHQVGIKPLNITIALRAL